MKVLVNDLIVLRERSGIAAYTHHLLRSLPAAAPDIQVVRLSETMTGTPLRWLSKAYESARKTSNKTSLIKTGIQFGKKFGHSALDTYVGALSRLGNWPLYHEPDTIPLPVRAPTLSTVHDLSVSLFPEWHPEHRVKRYEANLKEALDRIQVFSADSHATKQDMIRLWGVEREKIHVVYLAPRSPFRPLPAEVVEATRNRHGLPPTYLLFLGNIEPRKNVAGLIRAYSRLSPALRNKFPLILAGGWGWNSDEVRGLAEAQRVRSLGYVSDEDLVAILNGASAMVYPSFYEGFGLPPLEAMACNVPVITTHGGSLKEVVESAALIVDPAREDEIEQALARLLETPSLAEELRARGREQLKKFSWEKTARETAEIYRKFLLK